VGLQLRGIPLAVVVMQVAGISRGFVRIPMHPVAKVQQ